MINYTWQVGDEEYLVAARFLPQSGCSTTTELAALMEQVNGQVGNGSPVLIYDWATIQPGTIVRIPLAQNGIN